MGPSYTPGDSELSSLWQPLATTFADMQLPCPSPDVGLSPCPLGGMESSSSAACLAAGVMYEGKGWGRGQQGRGCQWLSHTDQESC